MWVEIECGNLINLNWYYLICIEKNQVSNFNIRAYDARSDTGEWACLGTFETEEAAEQEMTKLKNILISKQ